MAGLDAEDLTGVIYDPLRREWRTAPDHDVNYWMSFGRNGP
jgi:2-polyprenyl-3-methyl-5-hydroxy-6-metoxy-1,4-benzoquinol methylase